MKSPDRTSTGVRVATLHLQSEFRSQQCHQAASTEHSYCGATATRKTSLHETGSPWPLKWEFPQIYFCWHRLRYLWHMALITEWHSASAFTTTCLAEGEPWPIPEANPSASLEPRDRLGPCVFWREKKPIQDSPTGLLPACPPGLRSPRPHLPPGSCWHRSLHHLETTQAARIIDFEDAETHADTMSLLGPGWAEFCEADQEKGRRGNWGDPLESGTVQRGTASHIRLSQKRTATEPHLIQCGLYYQNSHRKGL